jgi:hypothetical protein
MNLMRTQSTSGGYRSRLLKCPKQHDYVINFLFPESSGRAQQIRILFALPGLHRYNRGAELTFISIARELCKLGER